MVCHEKTLENKNLDFIKTVKNEKVLSEKSYKTVKSEKVFSEKSHPTIAYL